MLAVQTLWDIREPVSALTHGAAALFGVVALILLVRRARRFHLSRSKRIGLWAFGISMVLLYTASTLFHWLQVPPDKLELLNKIDHAGVFLFIAGTMIAVYSIVECKIQQSGYWVRGALLLATLAGLLNLFVLTMPRWVTAGAYLTLGWSGTVGIVQVAATSENLRQLRLFLCGIGIYTVAAVMFVAEWPVLWPGYFEAHEMFHVMVMAGSALHFRYLYVYCAV